MFVFYNANPEGKMTLDCAKRAITVVTGMNYRAVERGIVKHKRITGATIYKNKDNALSYISTLGAQKVNLTMGERTVGDFVRTHPKGAYIIDTPKHWTAIVDGVIYDTWNPENEVIDRGAFSFR